MDSSNNPTKIQLYKILGKSLQYYGDTFCTFALILEETGSGKFGGIIVTKISNIFWKLGLWFYTRADKYAWSYILPPNKFPAKKYGD